MRNLPVSSGATTSNEEVTQTDDVFRQNDHRACFLTFMIARADTDILERGVEQGVPAFSTRQPIIDQQLLQNLVRRLASELVHFADFALDDGELPQTIRQTAMPASSFRVEQSFFPQNGSLFVGRQVQGEGPLEFVIVLGAMTEVAEQVLKSHGTFASSDFVAEEVAVVGGTQGLHLVGNEVRPRPALVEAQVEVVEDVFEVHQLITIIINQ